MANITTALTGYPSAVDTRTTLTDDPNGDEIVASHPNGTASAVIAVETELGINPSGTASTVVGRLDVATNSDGTIKQAVIQSGTGTAITYANGVFTISYSADSAGVAQNVGIDASVAGNALTVTLVDGDGNALTDTSPSIIPFRPVTITTAGYTVLSVPTPTSVVLPAGGTLGFANSETGRIYTYGMFVNNTTFEMALARQGNFDDSILQTTTAIGTGSDGDSMLYSTIARGGIPIKLLGYVELTGGSSAGNWSNAPSKKQVYGPGVHRTGEVVQYVQTTTGAGQTAATTGYNSALNPTPTGGTQWMSLVMTPTSVVNKLRVTGSYHASNNGTNQLAALFSTAQDKSHLLTNTTLVSDADCEITLAGEFPVPRISSTTFFVMGNGTGGSTTRLNQNSGGALYGGANQSSTLIEEIFS